MTIDLNERVDIHDNSKQYGNEMIYGCVINYGELEKVILSRGNKLTARLNVPTARLNGQDNSELMKGSK